MIPDKIKQLREQAGLSQSQLAQKIGCDTKFCERMGNGSVHTNDAIHRCADKTVPCVGGLHSGSRSRYVHLFTGLYGKRSGACT